MRRLLRNRSRVIRKDGGRSGKHGGAGELISEAEYPGFRSAIFYVQLSEHIDVTAVCNAVNVVDKFLGPRRKRQFVILFLNDEKYKLIVSRLAVRSAYGACTVIEEYLAKLSLQHEAYSGVMYNLLPAGLGDSLETTLEDICILFHSDRGVVIDTKVKEQIEKLRLNWVNVSVEKGKPVTLTPIS